MIMILKRLQTCAAGQSAQSVLGAANDAPPQAQWRAPAPASRACSTPSLLDDLRKLYAARPERLRLSYLTMPDLLRESGSFGTLRTEGFSDKTARPAPRA
jgi:hypothetical protein